MDNTDKMEDWRMLTVGRKSAARSRMRKEKDNVRMTRAKKSRVSEMCRESRTDMGHGDIRQMARSAQLCLHYSHWSSKNSHETKVIPGGCAVCVRRWTPPVRLPANAARAHAFFFFCSTRAELRLPCCTHSPVEIHTMRVSQSMRLNSQAQTNCLLFSRGQGLVGLHSTQSGPVFTQQHSTSLGAPLGSFYLLPVHAVTLPVQGCRTCSCPLLNNTLIYLNSSVISLSRLLFPWASCSSIIIIRPPRTVHHLLTPCQVRVHDWVTNMITTQ